MNRVWFSLLALFLAVGLVLSIPMVALAAKPTPPPPTGAWPATGSMNFPHFDHRGTHSQNGRATVAEAAPVPTPMQGTLVFSSNVNTAALSINGTSYPIGSYNFDLGIYDWSVYADGYNLRCGAGLVITAGQSTSLNVTLLETIPGLYTCPYCGNFRGTIDEVNAHILANHPGERLLITISWQ